MQKVSFKLPAKGFFTPNNDLDPLPYYYIPLLGSLYFNRIQQGLSLLSPPYDSVLEFGYGSGILLPTLASISNKLFGVDVESDPNRVNIALRKLNVKAILSQKDLMSNNYPADSFDLIVAFSVFEQIADFEHIVREFHRILKQGGELLVGMPRVDKLMEKFFKIIDLQDAVRQYHVTNYKDFLKTTSNYFELVRFSHMPNFLPAFAGLYFHMLFRKMQDR